MNFSKHLANVRRAVTLAIGINAVDPALANGLKFHNVHRYECRDKDGNLKWVEEIDNLVPTAGLNDVLTKYLKGSSYTATWYVGLVHNTGLGSLQATDTAAKITTSTPSAPTTNDWKEATSYDETVRQTLTLGSASSGSISNTASKAVFTINATLTIYGGFVISDSTKGGTSGVLFGEAAFPAARSVVAADTITVTVTITAATA